MSKRGGVSSVSASKSMYTKELASARLDGGYLHPSLLEWNNVSTEVHIAIYWYTRVLLLLNIWIQSDAYQKP